MTKCCIVISHFSFLLEEKLVIDFSDVTETSSHFSLRLDTNLQVFHTSKPRKLLDAGGSQDPTQAQYCLIIMPFLSLAEV